ncbi:helix-turn-helix domain-containing protein [Enterococcus hirae]|uniref:helix-turn-helix domain-containing protein n=1 Tax=Enterococcus hirae TaxID=1354 RepID=UPI0015C91CEA|nr:helix-turn-helix domain-containing protein [Enterococcus hirae]
MERNVEKMIESYIEKDIIRQIKVIEYLFELKKINIQEIADFLEVSRVTIKRDISKIVIIEPKIQIIKQNASMIEVRFWPNATRYELIKKIYSQSNFLHVCSSYLIGETNYLKIVEKEYISTTKVFYLKNKVEDFFQKVGIMNNSKEFIKDEFKMRLILLTIWMRIDPLEQIIDKRLYHEAANIVRLFVNKFSNSLNAREKYFLQLATYLSLKRQKNKLTIPQIQYAFIQQSLLYHEVSNLLTHYHLDIKEVMYISMMYRLLNQNLPTYNYVIIEHEEMRKMYIDNIPEMSELIHQFEIKFDKELLKNIMFEKPFLRFIISSFLNRQMFLVEKHYFLGERQRLLYKEIKKLVEEWNKKYQLNIQFSKRTTEKFCLQISEILLNNCARKWNVFIVAEDEFSHIAYREWIRQKINTTNIILDSVLYYSIDSLPMYIDIENSIVICERTLMNSLYENIRSTKTFPISLYSITEDMQKFFSYVFYSKDCRDRVV